MKRKTDREEKRVLRDDEELLWTRVKRTIIPEATKDEDFGTLLKELETGKRLTKVPKLDPKIETERSDGTKDTAKKDEARVTNRPLSSSPIDERTAKKLVKGKTSIDGRLDLHGMTQIQAHRALFHYVQESYFEGKRIVLVITGKGNMGHGILRSEVPKWLTEPAFSNYVSGYRVSHITHGGTGALYVRIRKKRS